jgi:hypothetical protein
MNRILSKIISAGILSVIWACVAHIYYVKAGQLGREAFLSNESARFDREFTHPHSMAMDEIAAHHFVVRPFKGFHVYSPMGPAL